MDIIINLILLIFLGYVIYLLSYSMFFGAPFAALSANRIVTMFQLLQPVKKKKFLDIGSGDGRIVIAAAREGLISYGYEINPVLIVISKLKLKGSGVQATILLKDYWKEDFSKFDYVSVWGVPPMMRRNRNSIYRVSSS